MKLTAVSFNIRCCDDDNGNSIAERAPRLFDVTSRYEPDILGLQEYRPIWEPYIAHYYGEPYDLFCKYRNETEDIEGVPILWRRDKFDCLRTGYFWFSDTPLVESRGWDEKFDCYRICNYAVLQDKSSGKAFTVMNVHYGFGDKGQIASSQLLYDFSREISDLPTFIVGDFNMTPDSPGYAAMIQHFRDVNACTAKDPGTTYHAYQPEITNDAHIDFCFIDEKITPLHYQIMTDTVDGKYPSDHFGIYMELDV